MATYKVLQDIEAEDKFLGPLSLKQFIYASISVVCGYLSFLALTKGIWIIAAIFSPVITFGIFLAWPWAKDQPTEIWLLAKIRFFLKPRRRIWDQSGLKELVTITVPKKIEKHLTDGLSQYEVKSRLHALANTIDSRGWAVKNINVNLFSQPSYVLNQTDSDRLIDPTTIPQDLPNYDSSAVIDILDEQNSPTAQNFSQMMAKSNDLHRQQISTKMSGALSGSNIPNTQQPNTQDNWFIGQNPKDDQNLSNSAKPYPTLEGTINSQSKDEEALLEKIHEFKSQPNPANYHERNIKPKHQNDQKSSHKRKSGVDNSNHTTDQVISTPTPDPAILNLANNDDLSVATIARQAEKNRKLTTDDEVIITLR